MKMVDGPSHPFRPQEGSNFRGSEQIRRSNQPISGPCRSFNLIPQGPQMSHPFPDRCPSHLQSTADLLSREESWRMIFQEAEDFFVHLNLLDRDLWKGGHMPRMSC